jgi:hypothetical protein
MFANPPRGFLSGNTASRTQCSAAKQLGISKRFTAGGQYTEVSITRVFFSNSADAKKLLYTGGK